MYENWHSHLRPKIGAIVKKPHIKKICLLSCFIFLVSCSLAPIGFNATSTQIAAEIYGTLTALAPSPTVTLTRTPTLTATSTSTPIPTVTQTRTPTATPTPGIDTLALTIDDLPPGFTKLSANQLEDMRSILPAGASGFGFNDSSHGGFISGFLVPLKALEDQSSFDASMPLVALGLANTVGADANITDMTGIDAIGQARIGISCSVPIGNSTGHWDVVTFRRAQIGVILVVGYLENDAPAMSIIDISRLMDERIILYLALATFPTSYNANSIAGTWVGSVIAADNTIVSELVLEIQNECSVEQKCGKISDNRGDCSGDIYLREIIGKTFVFEEQNMAGSDTCFSGAYEYIRLLSSGKLLWRSEYTSDFGEVIVSKSLLDQQ